jgi:hypothetical protein
LHCVREREKLAQEIGARGALFGTLDPTRPPKTVPITWRILGAKPVDRIEINAGFSEQDRESIKRVFTEADVDDCIPDSGFFSRSHPNARFSSNP